MAEVTVCSDFGAQENKVCQTISIVSPSVFQEVMEPDAMILVFFNIKFQANFFTFLFQFHQEAL